MAEADSVRSPCRCPGADPGERSRSPGARSAARAHGIGGDAPRVGARIGLAGTLALRPALALLAALSLPLHALALLAFAALAALALHPLALLPLLALAALAALALHPLALALLAFATLAALSLSLSLSLALHPLALALLAFARLASLALHALALALTLHALTLARAILALHALALSAGATLAAGAAFAEAAAARPGEAGTARTRSIEAGPSGTAGSRTESRPGAARIGTERVQSVPALAAQHLDAALAPQFGTEQDAADDAADHGARGGIAGVAVLGEAFARGGQHRRQGSDRNHQTLHAIIPPKLAGTCHFLIDEGQSGCLLLHGG